MPEKKCLRYRTIKVGKTKATRGYAHICVRKTKGKKGGRTEITRTGIHKYKMRKVV
jgi:hypothetical protein